MPAWILDTSESSTLSQFNGFHPTGQWVQIMDDLRRIRALEEDWDGLGARAPSADLVDSAIELAESLRQKGAACPSGVVPGTNGSVLLEWQDGNAYMEAEVVSPYEAEWMLVVPGQPTKHWVSR